MNPKEKNLSKNGSYTLSVYKDPNSKTHYLIPGFWTTDWKRPLMMFNDSLKNPTNNFLIQLLIRNHPIKLCFLLTIQPKEWFTNSTKCQTKNKIKIRDYQQHIVQALSRFWHFTKTEKSSPPKLSWLK